MEGPPLGKFLASTEKKTRDKAIKGLASFLSDPSRDALPEPEMARLWKGVFYCYWMSDKPLVQQALSTELAELVLAISSTTSALAFLRGFWEAMVREWNGIDRFRLDKYLMLVRKYVNAAFRLLLRTKWEAKACEEYHSILQDQGGPLCPTDNRVPVGLMYHVCQIYIEELNKAIGSELSITPPPLSPVPLVTLLSPFFTLAARAPLKRTYDRVQSDVFVPLLDAFKPQEDDEGARSRKRPRIDSDAGDGALSNIIANSCTSNPAAGAEPSGVILKSLVDQIMSKAGEDDTRDASRRRMYALYKTYADDIDSD